MSQGLIPGRDKSLSVLQKVQAISKAHPGSFSMVISGSLHGRRVNELVCEADDSSLSSA